MKQIIEINGKKFASTKAMADLWDISQNRVALACKEKRIIGAEKDSSGRWLIPIEAIKPLEETEIQISLISILVLQNKKDRIDQNDWKTLIKYLYLTGYLEEDVENVKDAVISQKAIILLMSKKKVSVDLIKAIGVVGSIASIIGTVPSFAGLFI